MDPITTAMLASLAAKGIGGWLSGRAQDKITREGMGENARMQQESREDEMRKLLASFLQGSESEEMDDSYKRNEAGLAATQMDPYKHAKEQNSANVRYSFGKSLGPGGKSNGKIDLSALNPYNLGKVGDYFYSNVGVMNPDVPLGGMSPNAEKLRVDAQGEKDAKRNAMREEIMKFLSQIGTPTGRKFKF